MAQEPLATKGNFLHIYDFRVTKGKLIAAHLLEAAAGDVDFLSLIHISEPTRPY